MTVVATESPHVRGTCLVLDKVVELCDALDREQVAYCHWKSNEALDRSASGENDLDLLVARRHAERFTAILHRLGFKGVRVPRDREVPGLADYYAVDEVTSRFVHVHAHYQLVVGDDATKNWRLPIEDVYIRSARHDGPFRVPAPELELTVFVVRMVLKHGTVDAIASGRGRLTSSERRELAWLGARTQSDDVLRTVREEVPGVEPDLWERGLRSLEADSTVRERVRCARALQRALASHGRLPHPRDVFTRVSRRGMWGVRRRGLRQPVRKTFVNGGALVAIVGGDGSGKTSAIDGLCSWLTPAVRPRQIHLGKPPRSLTTVLVDAGMALGRKLPGTRTVPPWSVTEYDEDRFPGYGWLVWHLLRARDRRNEYRRARRWSTNGSVVICDRFPLPQFPHMDGGRIPHSVFLAKRGALARMLAERQEAYYREIAEPDLLLVLRVDPEIAVARRRDQDTTFVRVRNGEVWRADWSRTRALVVDAAQPKDAVLDEVRSLVWSRL